MAMLNNHRVIDFNGICSPTLQAFEHLDKVRIACIWQESSAMVADLLLSHTGVGIF